MSENQKEKVRALLLEGKTLDEIKNIMGFSDVSFIRSFLNESHPYVENDPGEFNLELIHDDIMALYTYIYSIYTLLQEMVNIRRDN